MTFAIIEDMMERYEVRIVARKKSKEKYRPDEVATLMTDLKRMGFWVVFSVAAVVGLAFIIESVS